MDLKQDWKMRQKLAKLVQGKLQNHKVSAEDIGDTVDFLAGIIGGIASTIFPEKKIDDVISLIKESIEYGMDEGIVSE